MVKKILILVMLAGAGCTAKQEEAWARVTQRQLNAQGKLVVAYVFDAKGKAIAGVLELPENTVLPNDSLKVVYEVENPVKNTVSIP